MERSLGNRLAQLSDEQLIPLCLDNQDGAFEVLVRRYQHRIVNLIYRAIGSRERAEELAQDAFVRVFKNLDRFDAKYRFSTWLYTIAKNLIRTEFGQMANKPRLTSMGGDHAPVLADSAPRPDALASGRELASRIEAFLNEMTEKYRVVILMREYQHMSYEQIAEVFQCPEGTIKTWLFRAKKELAQKLRKIGYEL